VHTLENTRNIEWNTIKETNKTIDQKIEIIRTATKEE